MKAKKEQIAQMKKEKINVNTNTKIETESKAKRDRLDEAVRKVLLYKDMQKTENQGDMDPSVKMNQMFIRETIENNSGSINVPGKIY